MSSKRGFTFGDAQFMNFVTKNYFVSEEHYARFFKSDGRTLTDVAWEQGFAKTDDKKSPGSPLVHKFALNMQLLGMEAELKECVENRLLASEEIGRQLWESKNFESEGLDRAAVAAALLRNDVSDPVLVGFKAEPRKVGKPPRLVSQVSVVYNLEARFVLGNHLLTEQEHEGLPTATRLNLTTQTETEKLYKEFRAHAPLRGSDIQGWEYSVREWLKWADCFKVAYCMGLIDSNWNLSPCRDKQRHFYALLGFYYRDINRIVQLPEGKLVFPRPGEESSGILNTYSANSFMRAYLSELVSLSTTGKSVDYVKTAGDDAQDSNQRNDAAYLEYGFVVTDFVEADKVFNFCSTTFTNCVSYQDNIEKSTYAICKKMKFSDEDRMSFDNSFLGHPEYLHYLGVAVSHAAAASEGPDALKNLFIGDCFNQLLESGRDGDDVIKFMTTFHNHPELPYYANQLDQLELADIGDP